MIIFFHGLIHLLGFAKAFKLVPVRQLSQPISKLNGSLCLLSASCLSWLQQYSQWKKNGGGFYLYQE